MTATPDSQSQHAIAYLSLGSNLGDRAANLRQSKERLGKLGEGLRASSLYETEPVEFTVQPWFLNCVVELSTSLPPADLMTALLGIEREMGRDRKAAPAKGPRLIDIDLLLYGSLVLDTPALKVPHPAMAQRRFVLEPLAEIAPQVVHPVLNKTAQQLLEALPPDGAIVRRFAIDSEWKATHRIRL